MKPTQYIGNASKTLTELQAGERAILTVGEIDHVIQGCLEPGKFTTVQGCENGAKGPSISYANFHPDTIVRVVSREPMVYAKLKPGQFFIPHLEAGPGEPDVKIKWDKAPSSIYRPTDKVTLLKNVVIEGAPRKKVKLENVDSGKRVRVQIGDESYDIDVSGRVQSVIAMKYPHNGGRAVHLPMETMVEPIHVFRQFDHVPIGQCIVKNHLLGVKIDEKHLLKAGYAEPMEVLADIRKWISANFNVMSYDTVEEYDKSTLFDEDRA